MGMMDSLVDELAGLAEARARGAALEGISSTHTATVLRTDADGTVWVAIAGGADETPCTSTTAAVAPGDAVTVEIANGRARVTGNASRPATDDAAAHVAQGTADAARTLAQQALGDAETARYAAQDAQASADVAHEAAEGALADAQTAAGAADDAQASAAQALEGANQAVADAASASASAASANASAVSALAGLSDVEAVVGTVGWIAEHGSFSPTADMAVMAGKAYYLPDEDAPNGYQMVDEPTTEAMASYALTEDAAIVEGKAYYSRTEDRLYFPTRDTEIVEGKDYYTYEDGVYTLVTDPVAEGLPEYYELVVQATYEQVAEPAVEDIGTYYERTALYYELSIAESVQNYIATHLALTEDGLVLFGLDSYKLTEDTAIDADKEYYVLSGTAYVKVEEPVLADIGTYYEKVNGYRAIMRTNGLEIRDGDNQTVGFHGETVTLGRIGGIHLEMDGSRLVFKDGDSELAYFGLDPTDSVWKLFVEHASVTGSMQFGDYVWMNRSNGNITLKYAGGAA